MNVTINAGQVWRFEGGMELVVVEPLTPGGNVCYRLNDGSGWCAQVGSEPLGLFYRAVAEGKGVLHRQIDVALLDIDQSALGGS